MKICCEPTCFSDQIGLWISRDCLLDLRGRIKQCNERGWEVRRERSVSSTGDWCRGGGDCSRCFTVKVRMRLEVHLEVQGKKRRYTVILHAYLA